MELLKMFIGIVFGFLLQIVHSLNNETNGANGELVTVVLVFRHGDRTPVDPYPKDPYKNSSFWPVGFGQLTNLGKQQHYALGQYLRSRYADFLPATYNEEDIYVRSTDVDRTLMSVDANLAGLYPPTENQTWNPALKWQPIPVHTQPENEDAILAMKKPCPRYSALAKKVLLEPPFSDINAANAVLYDYLSYNTGLKIDSLETMEFLYNTLFIEKIYNFTLPPWTRDVYPYKMRGTCEMSFAVACYTQEMARLKTGLWFGEMLEHMINTTRQIARSDHHQLLRIYSGHDTTIANILNALHLFSPPHAPPYAATILFELRRLPSNNYYVTVLYKNTSGDATVQTLPHCGAQCALDEFIHLLEGVAVSRKQWELDCHVWLSLLPFTTLQNVIIISCSVAFLLLLISMGVGVLLTRPKNEQQQYLRLPDNEEVA